jgi:hypothetical protein
MESVKITVGGQEYVPAIAQTKIAESLSGMPYVICRTYSAGVFAGYLRARNGQEVDLVRARRLWYWSGAASLSQLSVDGVKKPNDCKFPCEIESQLLLQVIEIIPCTEKARLSIAGVPKWEV